MAGEASHFNEETPFDSMVFSFMGMLVAVLVLVTVVITVWSFVRLDVPAALRLAIRAGLVLMIVGQMVGVQTIVEGDNTFGSNGALKVPHALTLHAVQVLPVLALLLLLSDSAERRRVRVVTLGVAGYLVLIASSMVQTYGGHAPLDLTVVVTLLTLAGLAILGTSGLIAIRRFASGSTAPTPTPGG